MRARWVSLLLLLAAAPGALAAPEVLVALPDSRGSETYRTIRQNGDGSFTDLTPRGLLAGTGKDGEATFEVRAFFKPTFFAPGRRLTGQKVIGVGVELGGSIGTLELVGLAWGSATPPGELFAAASSPLTTAGLIEVLQGVLAAGGDSSASKGFVIKSTQPLKENGSFLARFNVRLQEASDWTIDLRLVTLPSGRNLAEFSSTRRGLATLTVGGQLAVESIPVARSTIYRWVIPESLLQPGANEVRIRVVDPADQSAAEAATSVSR